MAINDDELLAAISGGIDSASTTPPVETPAPEETDETDETGDAADDTGAAPEGADETGDGADGKTDADGKPIPADKAGAADTDGDSKELGPDGKLVAKTDAELDPATGKPFTPEQIAAKKAEDDKAAFRKLQVEDPINAPIPKYLKETTQKRMTKLVEIAKDTTAKLESANADRNEILGMITDTGATATQYTQALQYLKMVNSRDPVQIQQAITVMQGELSALSRMAGVPVAGVDHLSSHADLKAAVESKQLTQKLAEEIAATREQRTLHVQQSQQTHQQTQDAKLEHAAGVRALNDIGKQLAARDPSYRAKAVEVLKSIQGEMQNQNPSQWAQTFLVAYTTYKPPVVVPPVVRKPAVPKNQPLRGNNPSGGQQKAPSSFEEAISMGIAAGTRR